MNNIYIDVAENCETPEWLDKVEPFMQKILQELDKDQWEVSVLFCDDPFIQNLNRTYRQIDSPTDILSFEDGTEYPDEEGTQWISAGDIAISVPTFLRNAADFGVSESEELSRLLIHGLLHLSGMDHGEAHIEKDRTFSGGTEEDREMLVLQEKILEKLGTI